jgi:tRNA nucleotidyltransferase (CCA-adding enzyme)
MGECHMKHSELMEILLSERVYDQIKQNETEIFALIPELKVCKGFEQKNSWHIYDVYEHILHVVAGVEAKRSLRLAALFHDMGKPRAFTLDDEGIGHFFGHWDHSVDIFRAYAPQFGLSDPKKRLVENLIFYHDVNIQKMTDEQIDKMIAEIGHENIEALFAIKKADLLAQSEKYRGLLETIQKQEQSILERVKNAGN